MLHRHDDDHAQQAYGELRLLLGLLLPALREIEEGARPPDAPPLDLAVSSGMVAHALDRHCARCGRELPYALLEYDAFFVAGVGSLCGPCYAPHQYTGADRGARHAQLQQLARRHPGLVAAPLAALLGGAGMTEYMLEDQLGGGALGLARLALAPLPRPATWEADIADLARWSGCIPKAIAEVLCAAQALASSPAPEETADTDTDAGDVPF
ncbi:MAG: hypothetical protein RLZZ387_2454 [Chloroflexota bacterium]|jgi:hypothetical protein